MDLQYFFFEEIILKLFRNFAHKATEFVFSLKKIAK